MGEETYNDSLTKILHDARGEPNQLEEFEKAEAEIKLHERGLIKIEDRTENEIEISANKILNKFSGNFDEAEAPILNQVPQALQQTGESSKTDLSDEFQIVDPSNPSLTGDSIERSRLRRLAAIMAVISINHDNGDEQANVGRKLGTAWAQDHRRSSMGLTGLAYSRSKRASWR